MAVKISGGIVVTDTGEVDITDISSVPAIYGPQGATGPQGPQGATGPQGPQGATGPQGDLLYGANCSQVGQCYVTDCSGSVSFYNCYYYNCYDCNYSA